jgi:hypothetical protein
MMECTPLPLCVYSVLSRAIIADDKGNIFQRRPPRLMFIFIDEHVSSHLENKIVVQKMDSQRKGGTHCDGNRARETLQS